MAQITLNSTGVASNGALVLQSNGTTTAVTINASQGVEFIAGTAALPAITTTGDTNTGIFFPAADTIAFTEGGVESMRINASGNVEMVGTLTTASRGIAKASMPAGTVLQVVSTTKTDTFSTASTSFVDVTGLSASITPTSATSKILVHVSVVVGSQNIFAVRLLRDSTVVGAADTVSAHTAASVASFTNSDANTTAIGAFMYLDSPATTSATTYKIQVITQGSTNYVNRTINDVDSATGPRSASSITVMEVAA